MIPTKKMSLKKIKHFAFCYFVFIFCSWKTFKSLNWLILILEIRPLQEKKFFNVIKLYEKIIKNIKISLAYHFFRNYTSFLSFFFFFTKNAYSFGKYGVYIYTLASIKYILYKYKVYISNVNYVFIFNYVNHLFNALNCCHSFEIHSLPDQRSWVSSSTKPLLTEITACLIFEVKFRKMYWAL